MPLQKLTLRSMAKSLPKQIQPLDLCRVGAKLEGEIPIQSLRRLVELVAEKVGTVDVLLQFDKDKQGFRTIYGKIHTQLALTCQRCLNPMIYPMELNVNLIPIFNETEASQLPEDSEPLIVTEEPMLLAEIVEDELLLNMPIIAKHEEGECPNKIM